MFFIALLTCAYAYIIIIHLGLCWNSRHNLYCVVGCYIVSLYKASVNDILVLTLFKSIIDLLTLLQANWQLVGYSCQLLLHSFLDPDDLAI